MSYKGERLFPLQCSAASVLEKNRLVTITKSTLAAAYTTYGNTADGIVRSRSDANDYTTNVLPLDQAAMAFLISVAGTVAKGDALVPTGTEGKAKTADYTAKSRSLPEPGSPTTGDIYIVPAGIDWEAGSNQKKKAVRGASSWTYTAATAGDVAFITDEGVYVVFNGTSWVTTKVACYAAEAGVSGDDIQAYNVNPRAVNTGAPLQFIGAALSPSETDADASVVISDERIDVGDIVLATIAGQAGTASIQKVVVTANTATVTLSGNGGAGTVIAYAIYRLLS